MEGFLTSGRHTAFRPSKTALRDQARGAREATGQRVVPQVDREIANHAQNLMGSAAFTAVMGELIDRAREDFENSALGPEGEKSRAVAHAQIAACKEIVTRLQAMADDAKIYDRIEVEQAEHD